MNAVARMRRGLHKRRPALLPDPAYPRGRAAVAVVFGGGEGALSLCFVKRAKRPGERWSGDMAFPGGWVSPADSGPWEAAVREAKEEAGLHLRGASYLGRLDDRRVGPPGESEAPVLSSFVFHVGPRLPPLHPDHWETEAAYWIRLEHLRCDANRTIVPWESWRMPGIRYRDHVIWGLTLWVFQSLESVVEATSEAPGR